MRWKKVVCISILVLLLIFSAAISLPSEVSAEPDLQVRNIDEDSNGMYTIIQLIADTYVDANYHWENYGSSDILAVWNGTIPPYNKYVSFLLFDLTSLSSSKIISAMLFLRVVEHSVDSNHTSIIGVHFYNESWSEDELTWDAVNWSSLNETATDTTEIYLDLLEHQVWFNWTITQDVQSSKGSFLTEVVKAENDIESIFFSSRETSYVPYLNITYIKLPVHNIDTGLNYATIQEAIDAPETLNEQRILVDAGTYYENVVVDKAVSLVGENSSTTIVDGNMTGDVVRITRDHVNITGFTIQRSGRNLFNSGISISSTWHCNISGNRIVDNFVGIYGSPKNTSMSNNTITNNHVGVDIHHQATCNIISGNCLMANNVSLHIYNANSNSISENNITNNRRSVTLGYSRNNRFYHNNFFNNTKPVLVLASGYANFWDNGLEGNYWDNYTSVDSNYDGIGDSPFIIDADNTDNFPLMGAFSEFDITSEYGVQAICNSTISDFQFNNTAITFNVSGEAGTLGFCRICILTVLMNETYRVFVNGTEILPVPLPLPCSNSTHNYLYFNYTHSKHEVVIIPEFPSFLILPLFMIATLLAVIVYKRGHQTRNEKREV